MRCCIKFPLATQPKSGRILRLYFSLLAILVFNGAAAEAAPLQYLTGAGDRATPVVFLTWGLLAISFTVIVVIGLLLAAAIWRRPGLAWMRGERSVLQPHEGGLSWLWIGVGLSSLVLLFSIVWTVKVLAGIQAPAVKPAFTIEITGHQWWWQLRYAPGDPARQFVTANEIHIPVGEPVRLKLVSADVIHSFWVPQLAGKMDAVPGITNETWIQAAVPGTYRGQCTEYCGLQHSHMGFLVIAQQPDDFHKWWKKQLAAPGPVGGRSAAGQAQFQVHCGGCHTVRGTMAAGALAPDLSHLMQRRTIAAGQLPNNTATLAHWITDPQHFKPGSKMPSPTLTENELGDVHAYLKTLD